MKTLTRTSVCILLALSTKLAAASQVECYENALTQSAINECSRKHYADQQEKLESVLTNLIDSLTEPEKEKLRKSQDAWLEIVKNDCDIVQSHVEGGTIESMVAANCFARYTSIRIELLQELSCNPVIGCKHAE